MKKTLVFITLFAAMNAALFAGGTASISPSIVEPGKGGIPFTINLTYDMVLTNGSVELTIPELFSPDPTTYTAAGGYIEVNLWQSGGTIKTPVSPASIFVSGKTVTITALNMQPNEYLEIIYGSMTAGGYGANAPMVAGDYYFNARINRDGVSTFSAIADQAKVHVTLITLGKSANAVTASASLTFTYTITYQNISTAHNAENVTVWDSVPLGLSITNAWGVPGAAFAGNYASFDVGTVAYGANGALFIEVVGNSGMIVHGNSSTNKAELKANDMYTNNYYEYATTTVSVQGIKLLASLDASPVSVTTGDYIYLRMTVTNAGNVSALNIIPDPVAIVPAAAASLYYGPSPATVTLLAPATATTFTWIFQANTAGTVYFTCSARGSENVLTVHSNQAGSNSVTITDPTPTNTFTPIVPTDTPTDTCTPVTPGITPTMATTPPTCTPTPVEKVVTDRNYINLTKGESAQITYRVENEGETWIKVFNLNGEVIRDFYHLTLAPGTYYGYWDGTNDRGKKVGKGLYFILVHQKSGQEIKKIIVIK